MSKEEEEIVADVESDVETKPVEVTVTNPSKDTRDKRYDSVDDPEYDNMGITEKELKEFENGNT